MPNALPANRHGSDPAGIPAALVRCIDGAVSPAVALMQALLDGMDVARLQRALDALAARGAEDERVCATVGRLRWLLEENLDGCHRIVALLRSDRFAEPQAGSAEERLAECRRLFDWAVRQDAACSVALYSLGNPALLDAATAEVAALLRSLGVLGKDRCLLDIGCGTGRFLAALAGEVAEITGIDLSGAMIAAARQRCAGLGNVRLLETTGRDLAMVPAAAFDTLLAVDSFPYLYQAGAAIVANHVRDAARILRPHGDLVVFNLSYRGDIALDREDVCRFAADLGFDVLRNGTADLGLWDGLTFHLRRQA